MNYIITQELAQAILNYLSKRPYEEVFRFINELQKLTPEKKIEQ
jgi:hypothetical protein